MLRHELLTAMLLQQYLHQPLLPYNASHTIIECGNHIHKHARVS